MSLGAQSFSTARSGTGWQGEGRMTRPFVFFPSTPVPFSPLSRASSHTSSSSLHLTCTTAASSNCHRFGFLEKSQPMQNLHPQTACCHEPQSHHPSPGESSHFTAISSDREKKNFQQGNHEKPPPYFGQHQQPYIVFKKKVRVGFCKKDKTGRLASQKYLVQIL